jgi:hypothetical protein
MYDGEVQHRDGGVGLDRGCVHKGKERLEARARAVDREIRENYSNLAE